MAETARSPVELLTLVRRVCWWLSSALFGAVLVGAVAAAIALTGFDPDVLVLLSLAVFGTLTAVVVSVLDA